MTPIFKHMLNRVALCFIAAGVAGTLICSGLGQRPAGSVGQSVPAPLQKTAPPARFVVVVDAAHGGDDGGGQLGASVAEKTVTLALSVRLRSLLTARGFTVVTTREGNVNLNSDARAQIANHATAATTASGGAACLSLHASEAGSGVHIFVTSLAPAQSARFLAWKTAQSAYVARSLKLAGTVNSAFEHSSPPTEGENSDANAGPIPATLARASLPGVDSMTCPAVAIEVAPIRGADRKVVTDVTDPQYQTQIVETLAAALLEWKTDEETDSRPDSRPDSHLVGGRLP
ncbi:N-acetylmuramoyl-L-alanine amidase [Acidicapsa acidisoli]|uniref:N-acetylmuramoyl-L-alanine amidase n=1 Tax=Acidicapsa acidisoli TaxID=1615681 RepID=UPI0021E04E88|nr:N-acetylmuramoyl-L-alanine amidase [Acidicapsa acidisoli]